jgi:uncharacterized repeat protein (TIGR03803 family)
MGRPTEAAPTARGRSSGHSVRQGDSALQLLFAKQLCGRCWPFGRTCLRPEGKPLWDDLRRGHVLKWHRLQGGSIGRGDSALQLLFAKQLRGRESAPDTGLVFDSEGNVYGTTIFGGSSSSCQIGCGTVFKLTPSGQETVLYSFTSYPDGAYPHAGLVFDKQGNLYGATFGGGNGSCYEGCGTVFKVTTLGQQTVLYSFCSQKNCTDGRSPYAGLVFDRKGNLYGTTYEGGASRIARRNPFSWRSHGPL